MTRLGRLEDLPPKLRAQVVAAMAKDDQARVAHEPRKPRAPRSTTLLQCMGVEGAGCDFPPTASNAAMDRHCDEAGHHRYELLLTHADR